MQRAYNVANTFFEILDFRISKFFKTDECNETWPGNKHIKPHGMAKTCLRVSDNWIISIYGPFQIVEKEWTQILPKNVINYFDLFYICCYS